MEREYDPLGSIDIPVFIHRFVPFQAQLLAMEVHGIEARFDPPRLLDVCCVELRDGDPLLACLDRESGLVGFGNNLNSAYASYAMLAGSGLVNPDKIDKMLGAQAAHSLQASATIRPLDKMTISITPGQILIPTEDLPEDTTKTKVAHITCGETRLRFQTDLDVDVEYDGFTTILKFGSGAIKQIVVPSQSHGLDTTMLQLAVIVGWIGMHPCPMFDPGQSGGMTDRHKIVKWLMDSVSLQSIPGRMDRESSLMDIDYRLNYGGFSF